MDACRPSVRLDDGPSTGAAGRLPRQGAAGLDRERILVLLSRWRVIAGRLMALAVLVVMQPTAASMLRWLPLVAAGAALRTWARGHIDRNVYLAQSGPFARMRHPLYVGSFCMGFGIAAMSRSVALTAVFVVVFLAMYLPKAMREEAFLATKYGAVWARYAGAVPALVPVPGWRAPRVAPPVDFSWTRVWRNREWQTWLGLLGALLAVWLHTLLR